MKWISVEKRLPEKLQKVLFFCVQDECFMNIYMGYLCDEGWDIYLPYSSFKLKAGINKVTHWMELPRFPEFSVGIHELNGDFSDKKDVKQFYKRAAKSD